MEKSVVISAAVEGLVDEAVLRRITEEAGGVIGPVYGRQGKAHLQLRLPGYNNAARQSPWVVLVDLDRDAECAPELRSSWLCNPAPYMCFRIVVPQIEAWLLADRKGMARFLGVPLSHLPTNPDTVDDAKLAVVSLARRSRLRQIQIDMVPRPGSGRPVGPAYASRLIEFVATAWQPGAAAQHSDSLRRCRQRVAELVRGAQS